MTKTIIVIGAAVVLGILAGNAGVYAFNRIPDGWLGAVGREPGSQRVKSVPWKYVLSATFIVCGIYIGLRDYEAAPAVFAACFLLAQQAMAAKLYARAPLQISALVLLCGIAVVSREADFKEFVTGAVIGIACLGAAMAIVWLILRRKAKAADGTDAEAADDSEAAAADGTGVTASGSMRKVMPVSETFALAAAVMLLCGGPQGAAVIAASVCAWMVRVLILSSRERKRKADIPEDMMTGAAGSGGKTPEKAAALEIPDGTEPIAFFIAVTGALWIAVNISHCII